MTRSMEEALFAAQMKARADAYAEIFGDRDAPRELIGWSDPELDLNLRGGGIFVFPPRADRRGWHYVTHGLSQPLDGANAGLACELVMSTPDRRDWPPALLVELVRYSFDEDSRLILPGDRMPTGAFARVSRQTKLSHLFATTSAEYPNTLTLPSGRCTLVHLVGATAAEIERAKREGGAFGTEVLAETLRRLGVGFVTDPSRASATDDPMFDRTWRTVASQVEPS